MKKTINECAFISAFADMGRQNNFSVAARRALFAHIEDLERDNGEEYELDVIAMCCDFSEHKTALEAATEYGFEADPEDPEMAEESALEWLRDRTTVLETGESIVTQSF